MIWSNGNYIYVPKYEQVTYGQKQADRFEKHGDIQLKTVCLEIKKCEATVDALLDLILFGDHLGLPVKYDFSKPQHIVSLELVSAKHLREAL